MIKNFEVCLVLFCIFFFSPPSSAQPAALQTDDLKQLIKDALDHNPELKAAREEWKAAQKRIPQASALPDSMATYTVMGPMLETRVGPQKDMYEFEQMIPFPGKLVEKRKIAASEAKAFEARLKGLERGIVFKVTEAYYDLYKVEKTLKVTEEVRDLLMRFEEAAQSRYASLAGSQRDVARAQSEVSETLERLFMLQKEKESLVALLNSLLDRRDDGSSFIGQLYDTTDPPMPQLTQGLDELLAETRTNRPEVLEGEAMKEKEEHARALARYEYAPDLTVGFQYVRIGAGDTSDPDDGKDAWMIPLRITIPWWQGRAGATVEETRSNLKSSEAKLKNLRNLAEYELKNAYYRFNAQKKTVELYQNALIPQAELAFHSDRAGYEAGKTDILNFIDSERVYWNARSAYYEAFSEALKSFAAIERAVGKNLSDY